MTLISALISGTQIEKFYIAFLQNGIAVQLKYYSTKNVFSKSRCSGLYKILIISNHHRTGF